VSSRDEIAPDFIEPIAAFRCWRYVVGERSAQLFPLGPNGYRDGMSVWEGSWRAWVTASCPLPASFHEAPDERCSCGFYALKSVDDAAIMASWQFDYRADGVLEREGYVLGRVELAGKVIEHESGFRAERARIAELIPTTTDGGIVLWLAARLDLPTGSEVDLASVCQRYVRELSERSHVVANPGPVDRLRLKTHQRHFRLIQGARND